MLSNATVAPLAEESDPDRGWAMGDAGRPAPSGA
jgi:hypothetical protein